MLCDPPYRFKEVHMELTTACNFRCGFCPLTNLKRPGGRLAFDLCERILMDCMQEHLTRNATFHLMGEALLHPQCDDVLRLCRRLGIHTRLVTNGSLFRRERYEVLYQILDQLDISYRTVDDMELQAVQRKLTFDEYLERVMGALELRASAESETHIRLRLFISPKTIPSIEALCKCLGVNPDTILNSEKRPRPYQAFTLYPWLSVLCEQELDWLGDGKRYPSRFGSCDEFETGFAVLANGDVTTCCWDAHGGNVLGNVKVSSLREILFSGEAEAFRAAFRRHVCPTETCRKCLGRPNLLRSVAYQGLSLVNIR